MDEFAVPIMPANDLDATLSFYERLGFKNAGSATTEWNYLIIRRGSVQLHFYGDPQVDPLTTSSSCYVYTEDADALYAEWDAIGVATDPKTGSRLQGPPVETDYGMREFALVDPSGNLIRVATVRLTGELGLGEHPLTRTFLFTRASTSESTSSSPLQPVHCSLLHERIVSLAARFRYPRRDAIVPAGLLIPRS